MGDLREHFPASDGWDEIDLEPILQLYQEYLKDRMSVPLVSRRLFDVIIRYTRASDFPKPSDDEILKPKDDEAFRLFLEESDTQN